MNKKGLIYGDDPKRITCNKDGILTIGNTEIDVKADNECIMPILFYGASGKHDATFKTKDEVYSLEGVIVRNGRIIPPPAQTVEIMALHFRADEAEKERDLLKKEVEELKGILDTNSLNFLIN
jgi:hypothetical protein